MFKQQSDVPFNQDEENKDDETGNDTDTKDVLQMLKVTNKILAFLIKKLR